MQLVAVSYVFYGHAHIPLLLGILPLLQNLHVL